MSCNKKKRLQIYKKIKKNAGKIVEKRISEFFGRSSPKLRYRASTWPTQQSTRFV